MIENLSLDLHHQADTAEIAYPIGSPQKGARRKGPPSLAPVLVHIHIPKTGGTSIASLLQRAGQSHVKLYVTDTHFVYPEESIERALSTEPAIRYISSHHIQTFPPHLAGRRIFYFTTLRDPTEQFISYLTFIKKVFKHQNSPSLLKCLPPDPTSMSLREFARWLLLQDRDEVPFHQNYTVNLLARQTYIGLNSWDRPFDLSNYRTTRLTLAKAILSQFAFVGLTERMEESVATLRGIAEYLGVEIPPGEVGVENSSGEFRDDVSWVHPDDQVGALLFKAVDEDRQLYEWAVECFENRLWTKRLESLSS